jgi:hypothetical protein
MKRSVFTLAILLVCGLAFAQNSLSKGQNQLNLGVGFSDWGVPVYLGFDHGLTQDITLGAELSYRSYSDHWNNVSYSHSITGISGNGNYHFNNVLNIPRNWDLYAGLNLGFYIWSSSAGYGGSGSSGLGLGAQVGGRYFLTDKVGLNLEFGGGNAFSGGKFGVTIKL